MKIKKLLTMAIIIVFGYAAAPLHRPAYSADTISFAVIFLGGPDTGAEGEKIIRQFMTSLAKLTGLSKSALQGRYFNDINAAKTYIKQNRNAYIMASIGFFLANMKSMKLKPLAVVKLKGSDKEQFYLLVKKGTYQSLKQLKGKILSGNVLYEDPRFINRVIFDGKIDITAYFKLKPTSRPLSAVRKVISGQYDAVLVNSMQYYSLENLDMFKNIEVIHKSPKMPALGLMMVNTKADNAVREKIVRAVTTMCGQEDTKAACKNFGIEGFDKLNPETLADEIDKYEGN